MKLLFLQIPYATPCPGLVDSVLACLLCTTDITLGHFKTKEDMKTVFLPRLSLLVKFSESKLNCYKNFLKKICPSKSVLYCRYRHLCMNLTHTT